MKLFKKKKAVTLMKIYKHNPRIDLKIKEYINKIDKFVFLKTILSCQGHFKRKIVKAPLFYYETEKYKGKQKAICKEVFSRIKPPYVAFIMKDSALVDRFKNNFILFKDRMIKDQYKIETLSQANSFFLDRKKLLPRTIVLSTYEDVFVSVSVFINYCIQISDDNFVKMKETIDQIIDQNRNYLFRLVIDILDKLN